MVFLAKLGSPLTFTDDANRSQEVEFCACIIDGFLGPRALPSNPFAISFSLALI
jgi:hypothetical protein